MNSTLELLVGRILFLILFLMFFASVSACGSVERHYDLSTIPPFSSYANKNVILTRDIFLIADRMRQTEGEPAPISDKLTTFTLGYTKHYCDNAELGSYENNKYISIITIHAGQTVHVGRADLWSIRESIFQGFFQNTILTSPVKIALDIPGWPHQVKVDFDYSILPGALVFENGRAKIRPAPWESINIPEVRYINWPDDKYLLPSDKSE